MTATSTGRLVALSLAFVATCGTALFFGITHVWREPPVSTTDATAAPPAASGVREERPPAFATAQAEASALAAELAVSASSGSADEPLPAFDIARIERTGEAVIAGRAVPGAIVELLRNGERHDQAVADPSGQFAMVPPRLPPGAYELTLRSRLPDGTLATSKQGVVVGVNDVEPNSGAARSQAEVSLPDPDTTAAIPLPQDQDSKSSQARPQTPLRIAKEQDGTASLSHGGSSSAGAEPRISTRVVSRGDSLWRISRVTYGVGTQYAAVYKANRSHIRDPNRIFPGQIVVLPTKAR
jgi:nucleoid-associated protein YgaU